MIALRTAYRILRLPLDFLILNYEFLRITAWTMRRFVARRQRVQADPYDPCTSGKMVSGDERATRLCAPVRKYGNAFVLGLVCRRIRSTDIPELGFCRICGRSDGYFRISRARYWTAALVLLLIWALIGGGVYSGFQGELRALARRVRGAQPSPTPIAASPADGESRTDALTFVARGNRLLEAGDSARARLAFKNAVQRDPANVDAQLGLGRCAQELGLATEARQALERAVALDPANLDAHYRLARMAADSDEPEVTLEHAAAIVAIAPDQVEAHLLLSAAHLSLRQMQEAEAAAQTAAELAPTDKEPILAQAAVRLANGNLDGAESLYRKGLDLDPDLVEAKIGLAKVHRMVGDTDAAMAHMQACMEMEPDNPEVITELAELHVARRELAAAIRLYERLTGRLPGNANARVRLAELFLVSGRIDEGYQTATALLEEHPSSLGGHLILAELFRRLKLPSLAEEHCRRALVYSPGNIPANKMLARVLMRKAEHEKAAQTLATLARALPNDFESQLNLGICLEALGQFDKAAEAYQDAAARNAESHLAHFRLGRLLAIAQGEHEAGIRYLRRALESAPENADVLNSLALALLQSEQGYDEALALARQAHEQEAENSIIQDTLGWALFHQRDYDEASAMFRTSLEAAPNNPMTLYHLGAALAAKGELQDARRALKTAVARNADFKEAEAARELLDEVQTRLAAPE